MMLPLAGVAREGIDLGAAEIAAVGVTAMEEAVESHNSMLCCSTAHEVKGCRA